jgi:branched-chain amino acid transport system permease protein
LNAVRDNPERVEFIGYNTQQVRFRAFIIAGFFAGIAGGLGALNFEIVTAEVVGPARSGAYLLFTFLGGATFFFGPIIGGILMVLAFVLLSEITKAWLLYLGLVFLFMVIYAPGGLAGLIMANVRVMQVGALRRLVPIYAGMAFTCLLMLAGAGALVEMIYHQQLNASLGPDLPFAGLILNAQAPSTWLVSLAIALVGWAGFEWLRQRFMPIWADIQSEINTPAKQEKS